MAWPAGFQLADGTYPAKAGRHEEEIVVVQGFRLRMNEEE